MSYIYQLIKKNPDPINRNIKINYNFCKGAFFELLSNNEGKYLVQFIDNVTKRSLYDVTINNNCWAKCGIEYFVEYNIKVTDLSNGNVIFNHVYDAKDKKIFITIESKSLGDTLAWFPYAEEFRKKHNCELVVCTFWNYLIAPNYPNIQFIEPGEGVENIYAQYNIGWYHDNGKIDLKRNPIDPKPQPMQKTATDILGLEYKEIKSIIIENKNEFNHDKPYICIATHSTAQAKYWNNSNGWQEVVNYIKAIGYDVFLISKEGDGFMGNKFPDGIIHIDHPVEALLSVLRNSKGFIGLSSGLSWLAWSLNIPTVLISGFTKSYTEPISLHRVSPNEEKVCSGCFNKHILDAGDWNWCPEHKNTEKQFECSKTISSNDVISSLQDNIFI